MLYRGSRSHRQDWGRSHHPPTGTDNGFSHELSIRDFSRASVFPPSGHTASLWTIARAFNPFCQTCLDCDFDASDASIVLMFPQLFLTSLLFTVIIPVLSL